MSGSHSQRVSVQETLPIQMIERSLSYLCRTTVGDNGSQLDPKDLFHNVGPLNCGPHRAYIVPGRGPGSKVHDDRIELLPKTIWLGSWARVKGR